MPSSETALQLTAVTKTFGPVKALTGVSMEVRRGEIHGLIGANGSGKSTLVKTLSGYHAPDTGSVTVWSRTLMLPVGDPRSYGMALIHQDLGLAEHLSVTENVVSSTSYGTGRLPKISWREQHQRVRGLLERLEIFVDPREEVGGLSRGNRTLVAVARAICEIQATGGNNHLLITDEPTSALSTTEATALWNLLRRVTANGGAALFISHHLDEVLALCDRVTVLRDGRVVSTRACGGLSEDDLVEAMVGATGVVTAPTAITRPPQHAAPVVLEVRGLAGAGLRDVNLAVHAGEIIGITGLLGMGQDMVPGALAGTRDDLTGCLVIDGQTVALGNSSQTRRAGLVLVPAERQRDGLWLDGTIAENLGIVRAGALARRGYYDRLRERADAVTLAQRFDIRPRDVNKPLHELSGGNQQKVMLAKWLQLDPRVVLLHEPTQGVDIGAKRDIHRLIREYAAAKGAAVLIVSSDHDEVASHCDRVLVMAHGRLVGDISPTEFTPERFMSLASVVR